jgi:hypothetical protein
MPEEIRIWNIQDGKKLKEIQQSKLNLEQRLEDWMAEDISILSNDLLVIGRQVETAFGGYLDLLCLNNNGDIVIIELKRAKTPREVTAQVLDYASWVKDISNDTITSIANGYLGDKGPIEKAFTEKFNIDMPDTLNESHHMLVVASEIDPSSERIIKYLSDSYGISINAATFQYFQAENANELLARVFLMEPSQVEYNHQTKSSPKRRHYLTYEELLDMAEENAVGQIYRRFMSEMDKYFYRHTTTSSVAFTGNFNGSRKAIFSLIPAKSDSEDGLHFQIYVERFIKHFGFDEETALSLLPENKKPWKYYEAADSDFSGFAGFFGSLEEVDKFINGLANAKPK